MIIIRGMYPIPQPEATSTETGFSVEIVEKSDGILITCNYTDQESISSLVPNWELVKPFIAACRAHFIREATKPTVEEEKMQSLWRD